MPSPTPQQTTACRPEQELERGSWESVLSYHSGTQIPGQNTSKCGGRMVEMWDVGEVMTLGLRVDKGQRSNLEGSTEGPSWEAEEQHLGTERRTAWQPLVYVAPGHVPLG